MTLQIRAFVCAEIPESVKEKITQKTLELDRFGIKIIDKDMLHITLFFFPSVDQERVEKIKMLINQINPKSFDIRIKGFGTFEQKNPHLLFAEVESLGVTKLFEKMGPEIEKLGLFQERKELIAHITVARIRHPNADIDALIDEFINDNKMDLLFRCESIKLVQSTLTDEGPIYNDIAVKRLG